MINHWLGAVLFIVGFVLTVVVGIRWFRNEERRKNMSRRVLPTAQPILFVLHGQARTEQHITEDLIGEALHVTGEEWSALIAAMVRHADCCGPCYQEHRTSIDAVRLMQSRVPPHLSGENRLANSRITGIN